MIKVTSIESISISEIHIFAIPGGPGLSSLTIRSLSNLAEKANIHFIDLPGTNDNPYGGKKTFFQLTEAIAEVVKNQNGKKYLLGHSYGGVLAAAAALKSDVEGLICLGTPFTMESLTEAGVNYSKCQSPALLKAIQLWTDKPSNKTFAEWLSNYQALYFMPETFEKGRKLLLEDKVSFQFYLDNSSDIISNPQIYERIAEWPMKKLSIIGANEGLIPVECLKKEAFKARFNLIEVPHANHFLMLDQPLKTKEAIESFIFFS